MFDLHACGLTNEPGPLSFVFVMIIVAASMWITTAQNNSTPTATIMVRLIK